jgi:hypothetical protein
VTSGEEARARLDAALAAVRSYSAREDELFLELRAVQAQRAAHDAIISDVIRQCESMSLSSDGWRRLLDGIRREVSMSLSRHSM